MTTILVSSDDSDVAVQIGKKMAKGLEYTFVGPGLLMQVAEDHGLPEAKLIRALERTPIRKLPTKNARLPLALIQAATLTRLLEDDIVCTNLAAHLYVQGVAHVMMIRVLSDVNAHIARVAAEKKTSTRKARRLVEKERERRARWSLENFGIDESDPSIYDMVISLAQIEPDKVVDIVKDMSTYRKFRPMTYSRKCLNDLALSARVRVALLPSFHDVRVSADGDTATVFVKCSKGKKQQVAKEIKEIAGKLDGVQLVKVHAVTSQRQLEQAPELEREAAATQPAERGPRSVPARTRPEN
jgi:cytidylate kinase/ribosome-binding factor A